MEENFSIRWWNHRYALYKAIRALQNQETFADVILVCESKKFEAHKFVLSACSEFFERELSEMPYRENFYLPAEIKEVYFVPLLDYMYGGEAIVKEEDVNPLLKAAEILRIRGLAIPFYHDEEEETTSDEDEPRNKRALITKTHSSEALKRRRTRAKVSRSTASKTCASREGDTGSLGSTQREGSPTSKADSKVVKDQPSMNVNDMLAVLINGEQSTNAEKASGGRGPKGEEGAEDPRLVCPHCQRQFHWRSNLTKHIRTHTGEKPYTCSECDYRSGYSEALKRHSRTHTGEKPYQCVLCEYRCKDSSSLKLHMNKHTGESSFACSLCAYKTRIRSAFVKHSATHASPKEVKQEQVQPVTVAQPHLAEPHEQTPLSFDDYPSCEVGFEPSSL